MICQVCLEDVSTGSGIFFGVCAKVFLESKVGEPLLKASHTPSDHIAQLLHSHTVSAGRGALLLSVKRIYSFKHPQTDELVCLSPLHTNPLSSCLPQLCRDPVVRSQPQKLLPAFSLDLYCTFKLLILIYSSWVSKTRGCS